MGPNDPTQPGSSIMIPERRGAWRSGPIFPRWLGPVLILLLLTLLGAGLWFYRHHLPILPTLTGLIVAAAMAFAIYQREQKVRLLHLYRAEMARRLAEERYRITLMSIGEAVIATDGEGRVELMNAVAESLTGWSQEEAQGRPLGEVFRIIHEETRQTVENPVQRVLREGIVVGLADHSLLLARDGTERPIADSGAPIRDDSGRISGVVLVFRDETQERAAQRAVAEARAFAEAIVQTVREPLLVLDPDLRVVSANRSFYRTFQVTPAETEGRLLYELGNRQWDIPALRLLLEQIVPQNTFFENFQVSHDFQRIGRRTMLLNARRLYREDKKTDLILLAIEDITERQKAEAKLKEQLEELTRWHQLILGREDRVRELKAEVNDLCRRLGENPRYPSEEAE